jgi:hypothetical protein
MEHPVIATSQRIMDYLEGTEGPQVSKFWHGLAAENLRMLRANGPETFKRSLSQNYFNWAVDDPAHPQMRTLLQAWADAPDRLPLQAALSGSAELEGVALTRYVTSPEAARTYTLFVGLLWWFATRSWPGDLPQRLSEPELGAPVDIRLGDGQRISQDLANSLREWGRIAPSLAQAGERPLLAEVGAGYGRLGYVALQARPCRYWVFDIAPALALSQWYLTSLFPTKRVFAWRPFAQCDDIRAEAMAADMAFFSIDQLALVPEPYFDVAVAISVLHEMLPPQSVELLQVIADRTRGAVYIKNWTIWDNVWDGVVFRSDILHAPTGMTEVWSREDDVIPEFTEKLFCRA